ncbi:hypothetical protein [White spot syndrome virus]|uniref:Uncharacterized protein n=1 Tax=White spot syndrome virus TaxID=342409 RepID=A0A2U8T4M2_9VIRU|nr:hypothetical protein [White spot syndrome virus]UNU86406.1 hypothetical protein BCACJCBH_00043 [White spot syndrome virus]
MDGDSSSLQLLSESEFDYVVETLKEQGVWEVALEVFNEVSNSIETVKEEEDYTVLRSRNYFPTESITLYKQQQEEEESTPIKKRKLASGKSPRSLCRELRLLQIPSTTTFKAAPRSSSRRGKNTRLRRVCKNYGAHQ